MNIKGIRTFTDNIFLEAGKYSYKFSKNGDLGLPAGSKILSIFFREPQIFNSKNIEGNNISRFSNLGLLTLKSRKSVSDFVDNYPLHYLFDNLGSPFAGQFFCNVNNKEVDWTASKVTFPSKPAITTGESVEYTIYYTTDNFHDVYPEFVQNYMGGSSFIGTKTTLLSVTTEAGKQRYDLSFSGNISIPKDAFIVGILPNVSQSGGISPDGYVNVDTATINSSFLNLKVEQEVYISQLPLNHRLNPGWSIPYIPISPIPVKYFNPQQSEIYCSNPVAPKDDQSYQFILHYICP